jgi:hypothetical protein
VSGTSLKPPARRTVTVASVPSANVGSAGGVTISPLTVKKDVARTDASVVGGSIRTNAWKIDPQRTIVGGYTGADGKNHIFVLTEYGFRTVVVPTTMGIPLENGGINASGDMASTHCDTVPCTTTGHGFVLSRDEFTSVDVPGAISTGAFAINARGDVVGFYDDASGKRHGFVLRRVTIGK